MSCLAVRNNDMVRLKYGNNGKIYRPRPRYSIFAAAREPGATMACRIGGKQPARRLAMNDGATAGTAASNAPRSGPNRTVALIGLMGAGKSGRRAVRSPIFFSAMARVNFAAARSESSPACWRGRRLFWRPAVAPLCRR